MHEPQDAGTTALTEEGYQTVLSSNSTGEVPDRATSREFLCNCGSKQRTATPKASESDNGDFLFFSWDQFRRLGKLWHARSCICQIVTFIGREVVEQNMQAHLMGI